MAKKITTFDFDTRRGRGSKYPYQEWFDGGIWVLTPGEDFDSSVKNLRATLYAAARRMGVAIKTGVDDDGNVVVQMAAKGAKKAPAKRAAAKPTAKK